MLINFKIIKLSNDIYIHFALEREIWKTVVLNKHAETLRSILGNANLSGKFLVSTNLFTNIPLQETRHKNKSHFAINSQNLKNSSFLATSQTHLLFNSKFYNQIDGVAMDSPLVPVLANIFMVFL